MVSPDLLRVFDLYRKLVHAELLEYLRKQAKVRLRRGIYTIQVVLWLMIVQRL